MALFIAFVVALVIFAEGTSFERRLKRKKSFQPQSIGDSVVDMSVQRLTAIRALMASQPNPLAAYIIPTADAHNSEYIAPCDSRREWLTGFTGSAGTAVVTTDNALVWTDGRYYTQFGKQADTTHWTLMKQSLPSTPKMENWLASNLTAGSVVGIDPTTMTRQLWSPLQTALSQADIKLEAISKNLIDEAREQLNDPPAARPRNPLVLAPVKYTGKTSGQKVSELRIKMAERRASALILTALDEIAYTLNLRGTDIEYNPVFFSYLVIKAEAVVLFWANGTLTPDVSDHFKRENLSGVDCRPYGDLFAYLEQMAAELQSNGDGASAVWLSHDASEAVHRATAGGTNSERQLRLISEVSPVALMKAVKNDVELQGMRDCHIRDGTAVVRFLRWLHQQLNEEVAVTEVQAADKLEEFRKDETDFMGPSFETIAGTGENGAVIHYSPDRHAAQKVIESGHMFLLDSGGQYRDGTTDITRTRHMSAEPTADQKGAFTRVLIGQMAITEALFPAGVKGNVLDTLARKALWDVGLDYAHGTGHGVGHFLNVHEGPSGISWRPYPDDPGLKPAMILSNEPGYYKVGEYGIRHEDLVEVIQVDKNTDHPKASKLVGDFEGRGVLGFRTLTLVPNQRECIDLSLIDDSQLEHINAYHKRVFDTIGPILKTRGLTQDHDWLEHECRPITRE